MAAFSGVTQIVSGSLSLRVSGTVLGGDALSFLHPATTTPNKIQNPRIRPDLSLLIPSATPNLFQLVIKGLFPFPSKNIHADRLTSPEFSISLKGLLRTVQCDPTGSADSIAIASTEPVEEAFSLDGEKQHLPPARL